MTQRIGKLFHYSDPRLNQEIGRIYDFIQNGLLSGTQLDSRDVARAVGDSIGPFIPQQTLDGRTLKLESVLANRLVDDIISSVKLADAVATRIHADATWTIGAEAANVREVNVQIDTVKTSLTGVSSLVVLWASTSNNKNAAPPTTSFVSATVTTGTLLADLGAIPATPELCLLCSTTTAGRLIVDVEVSGAQTLYFYLSSGPMVAESGAVAWT